MKKSKQTKKNVSAKKLLSIYQKTIKRWAKFSVKQKVLLGFVVFILLSIIAYFSYAWYQGYAFKRLERKLAILTGQITAELGEPITQSADQSCSYASAKYTKGQLGCSSVYHSVYSLENQSVHQIIDDVRSVIQNNTDFTLLTQGGFEYFDVGGTSDTIYDSKLAGCSAAYEYTPGEKSMLPNELKVYVFCSTHPLRPFYDVSE